MKVYIHYNLDGGNPDAHNEVKDRMKKLGYSDKCTTIKGNERDLPNVALYHEDKTSFENVCNELLQTVSSINESRKDEDKAKVLKCIALQFSGAIFSPS